MQCNEYPVHVKGRWGSLSKGRVVKIYHCGNQFHLNVVGHLLGTKPMSCGRESLSHLVTLRISSNLFALCLSLATWWQQSKYFWQLFLFVCLPRFGAAPNSCAVRNRFRTGLDSMTWWWQQLLAPRNIDTNRQVKSNCSVWLNSN